MVAPAATRTRIVSFFQRAADINGGLAMNMRSPLRGYNRATSKRASEGAFLAQRTCECHYHERSFRPAEEALCALQSGPTSAS